MEVSSGSSSTSLSKSCYCGLPAKITTAKTKKNPGRRFLGCPLYKEGGVAHCKFFRWVDKEPVEGWPRRALVEAINEISQKDKVIEELNYTIADLRTQLHNRHIDITSIVSDEEFQSCGITGDDDNTNTSGVSNVYSTERLIITGLSALLICALTMVVFR